MIDDVSLWSKLESTHSILLVPIEQIDDIQDVSARIVGGKVNLLETGGGRSTAPTSPLGNGDGPVDGQTVAKIYSD